MSATSKAIEPTGNPRADSRLRVPRDVRVATVTGSRRARNRLAVGAMATAFVAVAMPLVFVLGSVVVNGAPAMSWGFLTRDIPTTAAASELKGDCAVRRAYDPTAVCETSTAAPVRPGMGPAVVGTVITTLLSAVLAIPLGILAAVYLHEYGRQRRLARCIRFVAETMVGVPSVMMGIFVSSVWVVGLAHGRSALAASLALSCLMLPIVVRSSEEMLRLVPESLREASAALGSRTWATTVRVVLPAALPGLVSGAALAVARAAGETAPLLFTIGAASTVAAATTVTGQSTTLSFQIYNMITNGGRLSPQMAWGAALTLIVVVLALTTLARVVSSRFALR